MKDESGGVESNHLRDLGRGIPIRIPRYLVSPPFVMSFYDQFLVFRLVIEGLARYLGLPHFQTLHENL